MDKGRKDETDWNEKSPENIKKLNGNTLTFWDLADVYMASKTLAEKGERLFGA